MLPERLYAQEMGNKQYYFPTDRGLEVKIAEKLNFFAFG